jgi:hypothetical protein
MVPNKIVTDSHDVGSSPFASHAAREAAIEAFARAVRPNKPILELLFRRLSETYEVSPNTRLVRKRPDSSTVDPNLDTLHVARHPRARTTRKNVKR